MAITKIIGAIHPPKTGGRYKVLKNTINYILNPKKTKDGLYTGAINCMTDTALHDMIKTKEYYGKTSDAPSERLGYHFVISFNPEEDVDDETAFKVIEEFCQMYLKNEYECVYSVHTDQKHKHGHICFNSVNMTTGKKFRYEDDDWVKIIQPITDKLCEKYGLHTLKMDTGMSLEDYQKEIKKKRLKKKYGDKYTDGNAGSGERKRSKNKYYNEKEEEYTNIDYIRHDIDEIILEVKNLDEFFTMLHSYGYTVRKGVSEKHGKYFSVIKPGMNRARRNYILGSNYSVDAIQKRIEMKNKPLPEYPVIPDTRYALPYGYWKRVKYEPAFLEKRYYAMIYRLGLRKVNEHPDYYTIRQNLKEIRRKEQEIVLIQKYGIYDVTTANAAISSVEKEIAEIESRRTKFYKEQTPYLDMLMTYRKMKKMEEMYGVLDGELIANSDMQETYFQYKTKIGKYGFSEEEIEKFNDSYKAKLKEYNKEKGEKRKELKSLERIRNEMLKNDGQELEELYEKIPENANEKDMEREEVVKKNRTR